MKLLIGTLQGDHNSYRMYFIFSYMYFKQIYFFWFKFICKCKFQCILYCTIENFFICLIFVLRNRNFFNDNQHVWYFSISVFFSFDSIFCVIMLHPRCTLASALHSHCLSPGSTLAERMFNMFDPGPSPALFATLFTPSNSSTFYFLHLLSTGHLSFTTSIAFFIGFSSSPHGHTILTFVFHDY